MPAVSPAGLVVSTPLPCLRVEAKLHQYALTLCLKGMPHTYLVFLWAALTILPFASLFLSLCILDVPADRAEP